MSSEREQRDRWRKAFAAQAACDFDAYFVLARNSTLPSCCSLHFLQMACEKTCKAFRCRDGSDPQSLQHSHTGVASQFPVIAREYLARQTERSFKRKYDPVLQNIRHIAREIELLAPAVDDNDRRPDNCEYPWTIDDQRVVVPADHEFAVSALRDNVNSIAFFKILTIAIADLKA